MRSVKMIRLNSLSLKVLLAFLAGTVLSIALLVIGAIVTLQGDTLARMDLAGLAEDMAAKISFDENGRPVGLNSDEDDLAWVYQSMGGETAYRVLDEAGNVALLSSSGEMFSAVGEGALQLPRGRFEFEHDGVTMHGATEPIEHGGRTWYFQVAVSTRLMTLLHRVALPLVGTGIVVFSLVLLFAFGLCAYITLRYTLKPLRDVSDSAASISPHSIHARLNTEAVPLEIAPLVDSFNRVLERLEKGYRVQKEFLATAAHELKTPLALIRSQIELAEVGTHDRDALLSDVEYMTRQVHQLLLLAEASEVQNYDFEIVQVQEVAEEVASYLQRMAEAASVRLTVSATAENVEWRADRGALFTLLKNLLENAIQHAPAKTTVEVEVQGDEISVRDWGAGHDAAQFPLLFKRFWRAAHRRDHGAGLGLSICQEVALAHGWSLTVERAEPGLRFRLTNAQGSRVSR
ncbi:Adaptive-response sensory-kinase SasA [Stenotrophomonas maltophilia]|uniref:histidine kinase n=1 Tax=Stenotrophomonas maltophilia TaxID=40324 RepID=A0AAX1ID45_STEMA|nr:ATP-binding protein [Stenotrophomonas maltophilia]QGL80174.1 HAMP domain-containing protein [Stenotrophomonas maltophilia]QNG76949.1 Adaptive-response sensory-kinase SasA [Stenotrophomonas maltophilia]